MATDEDGLLLAEQLLHRFNENPSVLKAFADDPVAELQNFFPELRGKSKDKIMDVLNSTHGMSNPQTPIVRGFLSDIASAAASGAAGAAVAALLGLQSEPVPE